MELVVLGRDKSQRVAVESENHRIVVVFHDIFALVVKYIYNYCDFHFILSLQFVFSFLRHIILSDNLDLYLICVL